MALSMSSAAAATGGGGALSTAAMAHHQPAVITRIQAPKPPPGTHHHQGPSMALGADVMDKRLTRLARSTRHLPLVCVDLAGGGHVSQINKYIIDIFSFHFIYIHKYTYAIALNVEFQIGSFSSFICFMFSLSLSL
jgi:hypothetical protein